MKKFAVAALAALAFAGSVFADAKVSFTNKVFEDDVFYFDDGNDTYKDFPALKERMEVQLDSERVDAYVKATVSFDDFDEKHFGVAGDIDDWWVEFRPVDVITLCLHDNIFSDGSYLPIYDDNVSGGNIGSDGFTVILRPEQFNKAFRIGFTVPFMFLQPELSFAKPGVANYFNGNEDDGEDEHFHCGFGIIFSLPNFQIGATVQNIACSDDRVIGASLNFPGTFAEGLTVAAGFTNAKDESAGFDDLVVFGGVTGENVINAAVSYEKDALSCAVETLISTDSDLDYNKYVAVSAGCGVTEALTIGAFGKFLIADAAEDNAMGFGVTVDFATGKNSVIGCEFDYDMCGDMSAIALPVYWKYSF